jgi:hypothetical protein
MEEDAVIHRGPDTCKICGQRVWRYRAPHTAEAQTNTYDEAPRGRFYVHPLDGSVRYCGSQALTDLVRYDLHEHQ